MLLFFDFMILPILIFIKPKYILSVIEKHFCGIYYSLFSKINVPNFRHS